MSNTELVTMGEIYKRIETLMGELDDSVDFMETLSDFEDEEGVERRQNKIDLVKATTELLKQLNEEYKKKADLGEDDDSYRNCSKCNKVITEGYVIDGGLEYYCTDECLKKEMTLKQFQELYADGEGESYWTEW